MGNPNDLVQITLTTVAARSTSSGYGTPLVTSYNATFPERVRRYSALADMVTDGMAATTPEYLAAQAMFAQSPSPPYVKIGRCTLKPTQVYTITPTVADSTIYSGSIDGVAWTFTSDASATLAEICTGVAAAIDAAIGATFTIASTGLVVTVTAASAGNWCSVTVDNPALLKLEQTHADPGIATDLAAIQLEDSDWYALCTTHNSSALITAAATWIEGQKKIYLALTADTECATHVLAAATDIAALNDTANRQRTFVAYHHIPREMEAAAWLGARLPLTPGTEQWSGATLVGPTATPLTDQQAQNLRDKSANGYYTNFKVSQTFTGVAGAGAPYFVDYVRFRDQFSDEIALACFNALYPSDGSKLPMTDAGLLALKNELLGVCARFENTTPVPALAAGLSKVTVPLAADISSTNRTNRVAAGITVEVTYTGAVNTVQLTIRVSL